MKIVQWLNGKKTHIAHAYWAVVMPSLVVVWPDGAPPTVSKVVTIVGIALTAFGYGHKAVKGAANRKIANEVKDMGLD